jgi:hypothetical protein
LPIGDQVRFVSEPLWLQHGELEQSELEQGVLDQGVTRQGDPTGATIHKSLALDGPFM